MQNGLSINLAKKKKPPILDIFLNWAVTVGRLLVIITEIVALGAFLDRFGLDRQISDLQDKVNQEQSVVKFLKHNEDVYRNLQVRLKLASVITTDQSIVSKLYQDIINTIPNDMNVSSITFSPQNAKLEISVQSITSLSTFVKDLRDNPDVANVSIDSIDNSTETATLHASISVIFTQQSKLLL